MKKWFAIGVVLVSMMAVLVGCAPERFQFDISGATRLEVYRGKGPDGTRVILTDPADIQKVTDSINSLTFRKKEPGNVFGNTAYMFKWYDSDNNNFEGFIFIDNSRIDYNGYLYQSENPVDTALFDEFLKDGTHPVYVQRGQGQELVYPEDE